MRIKNICVLGGSGFVGRYICRRLAAQGYLVTIPTRHPQRHRDLRVVPQLRLVNTNIHDQAALEKLLENTDLVVNLVGILNENKATGTTFRKVHVELVRKILESCRKNGVQRLLHMSALYADAANGASHYLRTKGTAENMVHTFSSNLEVTSFRPSIIFGPEDSFFNLFARILAMTPLVFPLMKANTRFQPVYAGDVADVFVNALHDRSTFNGHYDLCGPEVYCFRELLEYISLVSGHRRWIMPLPDALGRILARFLGLLPGKLITLDNFYSLSIDSVCSECKLCPTSIETVVPGYLGSSRLQSRNQFLRHTNRR